MGAAKSRQTEALGESDGYQSQKGGEPGGRFRYHGDGVIGFGNGEGVTHVITDYRRLAASQRVIQYERADDWRGRRDRHRNVSNKISAGRDSGCTWPHATQVVGVARIQVLGITERGSLQVAELAGTGITQGDGEVERRAGWRLLLQPIGETFKIGDAAAGGEHQA